MTTTIRALHDIDTHSEHYTSVLDTMRTMGVPQIRTYWTKELWQAIEGSHRLASAHSLGIVPTIVEVEADDMVDHDCEDLPCPCTVEEILDYIAGCEGALYHFDV